VETVCVDLRNTLLGSLCQSERLIYARFRSLHQLLLVRCNINALFRQVDDFLVLDLPKLVSNLGKKTEIVRYHYDSALELLDC